jgi:hypothetical protein
MTTYVEVGPLDSVGITGDDEISRLPLAGLLNSLSSCSLYLASFYGNCRFRGIPRDLYIDMHRRDQPPAISAVWGFTVLLALSLPSCTVLVSSHARCAHRHGGP